MARTYKRCPKCEKKGLYQRNQYNLIKYCRYCKAEIPHGEDELVLTAKQWSAPGNTPPEITIELKVSLPLASNGRTTTITLDQLRAITDILCSPEDRMVLQTHQAAKACSCGNRFTSSVDDAQKCLVLDRLAAI